MTEAASVRSSSVGSCFPRRSSAMPGRSIGSRSPLAIAGQHPTSTSSSERAIGFFLYFLSSRIWTL
jgi:hypothetical protein